MNDMLALIETFIVLSLQYSLVAVVSYVVLGVNLMTNFTLTHVAILFIYLYSGTKLYNEADSVRSVFISLMRDFSRKEFLRAKLPPLLLRFLAYLCIFYLLSVSDLKPLLSLSLLETLCDLLLRLFDHPRTLSTPLHPTSFTLSFLLARLSSRHLLPLYSCLLYYTVSLLLMSRGEFGEAVQVGAQVSACRVALMYCEERVKRGVTQAREGMSMGAQGERGYKMLRKAYRGGDRHLVIVLAKSLKNWLQ